MRSQRVTRSGRARAVHVVRTAVLDDADLLTELDLDAVSLCRLRLASRRWSSEMIEAVAARTLAKRAAAFLPAATATAASAADIPGKGPATSALERLRELDELVAPPRYDCGRKHCGLEATRDGRHALVLHHAGPVGVQPWYRADGASSLSRSWRSCWKLTLTGKDPAIRRDNPAFFGLLTAAGRSITLKEVGLERCKARGLFFWACYGGTCNSADNHGFNHSRAPRGLGVEDSVVVLYDPRASELRMRFARAAGGAAGADAAAAAGSVLENVTFVVRNVPCDVRYHPSVWLYSGYSMRISTPTADEVRALMEDAAPRVAYRMSESRRQQLLQVPRPGDDSGDGEQDPDARCE